MHGSSSVSAVIGALLVGIVTILAMVQAMLSPLAVLNSSGTTTTTTTTPIPVGVPLHLVSVVPWLIIETVIFCGLIAMWYFYHYRPRRKVQND